MWNQVSPSQLWKQFFAIAYGSLKYSRTHNTYSSVRLHLISDRYISSMCLSLFLLLSVKKKTLQLKVRKKLKNPLKRKRNSRKGQPLKSRFVPLWGLVMKLLLRNASWTLTRKGTFDRQTPTKPNDARSGQQTGNQPRFQRHVRRQRSPENEFGLEAAGNTTMQRPLGLQGHSKPTNVMWSFSDYRTAIGLV